MKLKRILPLLLAAVLILQLVPGMVRGAEISGQSEYAPYPVIETGYSQEVRPGTIRFISQNPDGENFYWDYWPEGPLGHDGVNYYKSPKSECSTCCISMALSYVGADYTPRVLLERGQGHTYWDLWGLECRRVQTDIAAEFAFQMDRYLNGNGQYSPPIIHLPGYSAAGHYMLVIGKISENEYQILDPWSCDVTQMTISGQSATYNKHYGSTYYDRIDMVAQYYNPDARISDNNVYPAYCAITALENAGIMSLPGTAEADPESRELAAAAAGDTWIADQLVENARGELWYRITTAEGVTGYIPGDKTLYEGSFADDLMLYDYNAPWEVTEGRSFSVWGSVESVNNRLTELSACIYPGDSTQSQPVTGGTAAVSGRYASVSWVDSRIRFGILTPGTYTYAVFAKYRNYYAREDGTRGENTGQICLLASPFTVVPKPDTTPGKPVLEVRSEDGTVSFLWEETVNTTHYELKLQKKNDLDQWETVETISDAFIGMSRNLESGEYRAQLVSWNSEDREPEGGWKRTESEEVYFSVHAHVPGDITGDGAVNNKDVTRLFRYLSGFDVEVNEAALDVTGDGSVNNKDVTRLFRYLSGFDVEIF